MRLHMAIASNILLGALSACTSVPPFVLYPSGVAPVGPKVADLLVNLKCELQEATRSHEPLAWYEDTPGHPLRVQSSDKSRQFNLDNIFQEIEYIADVQLTLDVTDGSGLAPSIGLSKYYSAMAGVFPATGFLLSVNGQLSETAHRYIQLYSTIDFSRLSASIPSEESKLAKPCNGFSPDGLELRGQLGLQETLATGFIANAMSDVSVFPQSTMVASGGPVLYQPLPNNVISAQVDFTVVEGGGIGPTWTLKYFKGPVGGGGGGGGGGGASSSGSPGANGLLNFNRQVKDQLNITFVPVCIRPKYPATSHVGDEWEYGHQLIDGTPAWANYLPPCNQNYDSSLAKAASTGSYVNFVNRSSLSSLSGF